MNILDQIKEELPWLGNNEIYDLTRGKPSPSQLLLSQKLIESISQPFEMDGIRDDFLVLNLEFFHHRSPFQQC